MAARFFAPHTSTAEALAARLLAAARVYAFPGHPFEVTWYAELAHLIHQRGGLDSAGARRHNTVILASGDRRTGWSHSGAAGT